MIQVDFEVAMIIFDVAKTVFSLDVFAFGDREIVVAHSDRRIAINHHTFIFKPDLVS